MKRTLAIALLALAAGLPAQAAEHRHDHGAMPHKLQLDNGRKWQTDAPIRQAMDHINAAMAKAVPQIHKNRFSVADYRRLGEAVDREVAYAVANCKLEPRADAVLHIVIEELAAGAAAMQGKGKTSRHDGAVKVLGALKAYGTHFEHPGWAPAAQ